MKTCLVGVLIKNEFDQSAKSDMFCKHVALNYIEINVL